MAMYPLGEGKTLMTCFGYIIPGGLFFMPTMLSASRITFGIDAQR